MFTAPVLGPSAEHVAPTELVIGVTAGHYKYSTPTELKTPVLLQVSLTLAFYSFWLRPKPHCAPPG